MESGSSAAVVEEPMNKLSMDEVKTQSEKAPEAAAATATAKHSAPKAKKEESGKFLLKTPKVAEQKFS
jgi:division protein CdvB (Snf7/Vps24/ESCRT-III family)